MPLPTNDVNEIEDAQFVSETPAPNAPPAPPAMVGAPSVPPAPPATAEAPPAPPATAEAPPVPQATAEAPPAPPATAEAPPVPQATAEAPPAPPATAEAPPAPQATAEAPPVPQATAEAPPAPPAKVGGSSALVQAAAEMGFEGLDFDGFGAFPIISLKQGTFSCTDGWQLPDPFYAVLMASRPKYIYKNGLPDKDKDEEFFYSYDKVTAVSGDMVEDRLAEWRSKGWSPQIKPYVDVTMELKGGEHDGKIVLLSVPKTSISRLSAHWANMVATGKPIESILTRIGKAPMVTSTRFEFTPISFDIHNG